MAACAWLNEGALAAPLSSRGAARAVGIRAQNVVAEPLNAYVIGAIGRMPRGGGYQTGALAFARLCGEAVRWDERGGRLEISPRSAQPSFCSEAVYMVLTLALQDWERARRVRFSREFWQYMAPEYGQADGVRGWGRLNANGPGLAKWASELGCGYSFTDIRLAQPGDFLKIFWTKKIGSSEFGHFVVFLGWRKDKNGQLLLRFWSSNMDMGYGVKDVPLADCGRLLFTRIHRPAAFANFARLPETDEWLQSLLKREVTAAEMWRRCGMTR